MELLATGFMMERENQFHLQSKSCICQKLSPSDPHEIYNLYEQRQDIVQRLVRYLDEYKEAGRSRVEPSWRGVRNRRSFDSPAARSG
jgi:hypothetical protein